MFLEDYGYRRLRTVLAFSLVGVLVYSFYLLDDLRNQSWESLGFNLFWIAVYLIYPVILMKIPGRFRVIPFFMMVLFVLVDITRLQLNASHSGGLFWFMLLPLLSFLVLGRILGWFPVAAGLGLILYIIFIKQPYLFTGREPFHLIPAYIVISALTFVFETIREKLERMGQNQRNTLQRQKKELDQSYRNSLVLLREIHHRVKNSISIILGIISLFESKVKDPRWQPFIEELMHRVSSIGKIHEMLYKSEDFKSVDISGYLNLLLGELTQNLTDGRIHVEQKIEPILFDPDTSMSLGLLLVELFTNSVKYGDRENGLITISLTKGEEDYVLTLCNNGPPVPDKLLEAQGDSLGISLILAMSKKLKGTLEITNDPSPCFILRFKGKQVPTT